MRKKKLDNLLKFSMFLRAGMIEAGPPLSTILGNFGINTVVLCRELNELTKGLPSYFLIEIVIIVNNDKTYKFIFKPPTVSYLFKVVAKPFEIFRKSSGGYKSIIYKGVKLRDFYLICKFKFNSFDYLFLKILHGILKSSRLYLLIE